MSAEYSVEVRAMANRIGLNSHEEVVIEQMLTSYADLLERIKADEGAVPDGWVVVPVEPTDAMCDAGDLPDTATAYDIYKAMLAAAPQPGESA